MKRSRDVNTFVGLIPLQTGSVTGKEALLLVSSSSQCCSGLASCVYLKAGQPERSSFCSVSDLQDAARLHAQH